MIRYITRDEFIAAISDDKGDKFAKNFFLATADLQGIWDKAKGKFNESGELMAAIIVSHSKRSPVVTNLKLLHTFVAHRFNGAARELVMDSLEESSKIASYYRVSADKKAIVFYEKIGFKFIGRQKTGCQLSMFRWGKNGEHVYDFTDEKIRGAAFKKGNGGCVEVFFEDPTVTLFGED